MYGVDTIFNGVVGIWSGREGDYIIKESHGGPLVSIWSSWNTLRGFSMLLLPNEKEIHRGLGWHHRLNGHEFEQAPGVGDGQGGLACCSPWGNKGSDMTEQLSWEVYMAVIYTIAWVYWSRISKAYDNKPVLRFLTFFILLNSWSYYLY